MPPFVVSITNKTRTLRVSLHKMKAIVNINGLIGEIDKTKGIGLSNIISQVQSQKGYTEIELRIGSSEGGVVDTGKDIYDYIRSLNVPITTVISSYCASISSIIFLAGDKRIMREGAELMIHNPWGMSAGDAKEMENYAVELRKIEKMLANIYHEKTNINQQALLALMREETTMSAQEALQMGFATEVAKRKVIANFNLKNMSKKTFKERLLETFSTSPNALVLQDANGTEINFETEAETPTIGDKATIDGKPAQGEVLMPNGETYTFEAGELKKITPKEEDPSTLTENRVREIVQEVMNGVEESFDALFTHLADREKRFEALAKSVKSTFKPHNKPEPKKALSVQEMRNNHKLRKDNK